jgi:tetratricopeptide (TPR) repeat protein
VSVSLCMIVKNESEHLDACLASAAGLADELIVVDTGSADDTKEIARRHSARVFDFPWRDDFAAARNESIRHAKGDWILWLDADDRVPPRGHAELRRLIASLPDENVAYLMTVLCPGPDGGPMSQAPHARLFRNMPGIRWQNRVHEQIVRSIERSGGRLLPTDIAIVHVGYTKRGAMKAKMDRNLRLIDLDLEDLPMDAGLLQARAVTLLGMGRAAEALVALNLCEPATVLDEFARNIYALRGEAYAAEGRLQDGLDAARIGLARFPRDTRLSFLEAQLLNALGILEDAESSLRAQLMVGEEHGRFASADRTVAAFRARHLLAEVLLQRRRLSAAELEAQAVIEARPSFGEGWLLFGEILLEQQKWDDLEKLQASLGSSADADIARAILTAKRKAGGKEYEQAASIIDHVLLERPEHQILLKAKAQLLFHLERGDQAQELQLVVRTILASDPLCGRTWAIARELARASFGGLTRERWSDRAKFALGPLLALD